MSFKQMGIKITNSTLNDFLNDVDNENYKHALYDISTILELKYVKPTLREQLNEAKQDILCGDVHDIRVDAYNIATYDFHTTVSSQK